MPQPQDPAFDTHSFLADLHLTLADSQRDVLEEVFKRSKELFRNSDFSRIDGLAEEISATTGCDQKTAFSVLTMVMFLGFGSAISSEDDEEPLPTSLDDLKELLRSEEGGLQPEEEHLLEDLLDRIHSESEVIKESLSRSALARGFLPMYDNIESTLELRSVSIPLPQETEEDQEISLVPIASIRLTLDSGTPKSIHFQVNEEDISSLLEHLAKIHKDIQILRRKTNFNIS